MTGYKREDMTKHLTFAAGIAAVVCTAGCSDISIDLAGYTENGNIGEDTKAAIAKTIEKGLITGIHFISSDGLFLTLLESAIASGLGFDITTDSEVEEKEFLFAKSRYVAVVSVDEDHENALADLFFNKGVKLILLGHVTKGELRIDDISYGFCKDYLPE